MNQPELLISNSEAREYKIVIQVWCITFKVHPQGKKMYKSTF